MKLIGGLRRIHIHVLLAAVGLVLARPTLAGNLAGTLLVLVGSGIRLWAAGALEKGGGLCTDGPYRWVRHPLYLGSFVAAFGFCVMMDVIWGWVIVLPLFVALYVAQVMLEERRLRQEFGEAHADYSRRVPLMLPRPPRAGPPGRAWQLARVLVNREHYHVALTCVLVVMFYLRHWWPAV